MSDFTVPHHVTRQPISLNTMDLHYDRYHDEKRHNPTTYCASRDCECAETNSLSHHRACHKSRLRRLLVPALLCIATVATIIFICCIRNLNTLGVFALDDGVLGVGKRALGARDSTGSNSGNSSFVNNKLYLIIVFVGLLLVLVFAIMLSAWCCRSSFENPCCCPCYLCACCGGLACLDCIACGLCAEGLEAA